MRNSFCFILILISMVIFGFRIAEGVKFDKNVTGYLKHAADANTIELANEELTKVINYLESNDMTSGYTSIFYETPDEDISFWYRNLKASQKELQNLKSESALEKTNVLMKLRETLLDSGEKDEVTIPEGLSVYPNNRMWAFATFFGFILMCIGFCYLIVNADRAEKLKRANLVKDKDA